MSGYEDNFISVDQLPEQSGYEGNFIPLPQQPHQQTQQQPVADLGDPSNLPQAETGYILNSANNLPGLNLIKEAGAGLRGAYAGAIAPDGQSFSDAFSDEYDRSRANQNALMQQTAQEYPGATTTGKVGAALTSMGYLPTLASTGSMVGDATLGGVSTGGYGLLSGFGSGSSFDERLKNSINQGISGVEFGGPMSAVAGGLSQAASGIKGLIKPSEMPAVQAALDNDIPIYKNNVSDSKALDYLSTLSNEIPTVLGGTANRVPGQQQAIADALLKPIGDNSGVLNSDAVEGAASTSGKAIGSIISKHELPVSQPVLNSIDNLSTQAGAKLTGDNLDNFNKQVESVKNLIINKASGTASGSQGIIPGVKYQSERQFMNDIIQNNQFGSTAPLGYWTRQLRNTLDDAFQGNMPAKDSMELQKSRAIYSNAQDLAKVTDKNPTGDYSFGSLYGKVGDNPNYEGTALAAQLLKGGTGNSGTAQRQLIINTAKGLGAATTGAAGLYGEKRITGDENPLADTLMDVAGAGLGAASMGGANRLMNPRLTPQNINGYQFMQPASKQAQALADFLSRAAPAANQIYNSGGQ